MHFDQTLPPKTNDVLNYIKWLKSGKRLVRFNMEEFGSTCSFNNCCRSRSLSCSCLARSSFSSSSCFLARATWYWAWLSRSEHCLQPQPQSPQILQSVAPSPHVKIHRTAFTFESRFKVKETAAVEQKKLIACCSVRWRLTWPQRQPERGQTSSCLQLYWGSWSTCEMSRRGLMNFPE